MSIICLRFVNYMSSILIVHLGWLGVNVTRLAKRSLRKGRTDLEILNLSKKYYIQTAFLEISKQDTDKVSISYIRCIVYNIYSSNF